MNPQTVGYEAKAFKPRTLILFFLVALLLVSACTKQPQPPGPATPWIEKEVIFTSGPNKLYGILTLPAMDGPHQDKFWARALYLQDLYLPALKGLPADQLQAASAATEQSLLTDPKDLLTRVHCPVLALFGENDQNVPAQKSARLYEQYLTQAGNQDLTLTVFPGVGHELGGVLPAYWATLGDWLKQQV